VLLKFAIREFRMFGREGKVENKLLTRSNEYSASKFLSSPENDRSFVVKIQAHMAALVGATVLIPEFC
jgi:hypothetical protein